MNKNAKILKLYTLLSRVLARCVKMGMHPCELLMKPPSQPYRKGGKECIDNCREHVLIMLNELAKEMME